MPKILFILIATLATIRANSAEILFQFSNRLFVLKSSLEKEQVKQLTGEQLIQLLNGSEIEEITINKNGEFNYSNTLPTWTESKEGIGTWTESIEVIGTWTESKEVISTWTESKQ